jgi:WD40 repeat protein
LIAFVYAFLQQAEAERQKVIAQENATQAQKNADRANEQAKIAEERRLEAVSEKAAADAARTEAVRLAVIAQEAQKDADQKRVRAEIAEKDARVQKENALREKERAETNEKAAVDARNDAQKQRYLATAKAMAIKSKELGNTLEKEALVAQQAYLFNKKYGGYIYDSDIYSGLYTALKNNEHPLTKSLEAHKNGAARAMETHGKGNYIYSGGSDGRIFRWSYINNEWKADPIMDETKRGEPYLVYALDTSPDGNLLVAGGLYPTNSQANFIELYDLQNGGKRKKIYGFSYEVSDVHFTPDGKGLYGRDNSGHSIRYSDLSTAKEVIASNIKILSLDLNVNGTVLAGAGDDGNLYLWDIAKGYAATTIKVSKVSLSAITFSPDGKQIIAGDRNGILYVINNGLVVRDLPGHSSQIEDIRFNHAGTFFASASKDYKVRLWNIHSLNFQPIILSDHDWVWSVAFTPDDSQLMVGINSVKQTAKDPDQTIHAYPTNFEVMKDILCTKTSRNMTPEEWKSEVAEDLPYEKTCENYPGIPSSQTTIKKAEK